MNGTKKVVLLAFGLLLANLFLFAVLVTGSRGESPLVSPRCDTKPVAVGKYQICADTVVGDTWVYFRDGAPVKLDGVFIGKKQIGEDVFVTRMYPVCYTAMIRDGRIMMDIPLNSVDSVHRVADPFVWLKVTGDDVTLNALWNFKTGSEHSAKVHPSPGTFAVNCGGR